MKQVYTLTVTSPIKKDIGIFTNKQLTHDHIKNLAGENMLIVDEKSDRFAKFHSKQMSYQNFVQYYQNVKNQTKLILRVVNPDSLTTSKTSMVIECKMFMLNATS